MSVSIRLPDDLQRKLDDIKKAIDNDRGFSLNLSYYKILKLLVEEAYKQLVLGEGNENKNRFHKNKRKN